MSLGLPQSKSYLKILGIPYYIENTNLLITTDIIERVLQTTHIFNNTILTSYLHIIKTSPKSNIAIIWIDIWDSQSSSKVKNLINRYFNISSHITIIQDTNINPNVPQYKNCWKWGHITFTCCMHGSKCVKYNSPHKVEHYRNIAWYCKMNFKTNLPRLETKKGESYPYSFKYINCKGEHQVNSNTCLF